MKRLLLAAVVGGFLAAPAFAFECPSDLAEIDAALAAGPSLSAEDLAEVQKLRDEGEALHDQGKHQESLDTLDKAKSMLGI